MKNRIFAGILFLCLFVSLVACSGKKELTAEQRLVARILSDTLMSRVDSMAHEIVKGGFNAGDGYGEVWIRDYNTLIELAMEVMPDEAVQDNLLTFFRFQGSTGDIVDGFIDIKRSKSQNNSIGYKYRFSDSEPRYAAHKNTVETDQESSLVQAVWRYVTKSRNKAFLQQKVDGKTEEERLDFALSYLMNERFDQKYGLLWGGNDCRLGRRTARTFLGDRTG